MEFENRRTFAIIAHPDAGKTTLTEKLLLFGGAIHMAGQVKIKQNRRLAHSDWMKIEQARGISVTTSVMTFEYKDVTFNLLDTPGHEDFSEDTYRTLTAVDSAVMVIDAAKGIEAQTRKLFEVCRLRDVPIITFINKMDREARDPFEIMDEIEQALALDVTPATWPIGMGRDFKGCYDLIHNQMILFDDSPRETLPEIVQCSGLDDPKLLQYISAEQHAKLVEDVSLIREACPPMDKEAYLQGTLTPIYFGSALKNFGIQDLIGGLSDYAPSPRPQPAMPRPVDPGEKKVTGFVFKVQANMDPQHRDRIAFFRICSGTFKRGMKLVQTHNNKPMAVRSPIFFFAQGRELADEAVAGDIIGIPNHGILRVGDTLSEGENITYTGIPNFAPEILRRVRLGDPMKSKHLERALESLAEEGVVQVFKPMFGSEWIVGVVGMLQLDVLQSRLEAEYGLPISFEDTSYYTANWVQCDDPKILNQFARTYKSSLAYDRDEALVALPRNSWELGNFKKEYPALIFTTTKERGQQS